MSQSRETVGDLIEASEAYGEQGWIPKSRLAIPVSDLGFRQGVTAVERLRTYGGRLWQLDRHLDRFGFTSAGLGWSFDRSWWSRTIEELLQRNEVVVRSNDVGIVLLATPGKTADGLHPNQMLHLSELDLVRYRDRIEKGQPVVITDVVQPPPGSWSRQWKVRSRLHYYMADQFANEICRDSTGVLVDDDGGLTESSIASLAAWIDGELVMPPADRVLASVSSAVVSDIAESEGWSVRRRRLSPRDCVNAEEIWLMGTGAGLWFADRIWAADRWTTISQTPPPHYRIARSRFEKMTLCQK